MRRAVLLSLLLLAVPLALLALPAAGVLRDPRVYRLAVLWGVPAVLAVLGLVVYPRPPEPWPGLASSRASLRLALYCGLAAIAGLLFVGVGFGLGWDVPSFGNQPYFENQALTALWALPACCVAGVLGWEATLRRRLALAWSPPLRHKPALLASALVGTVLALPSLLHGPEVPHWAYLLAGLFEALCREVGFCLLFAFGGGLVAAGVYRGLLLYLESFVINDWYGVSFPAWSYSVNEPGLYGLRALNALLCLAILAAGVRQARRWKADARSPSTPASEADHARQR